MARSLGKAAFEAMVTRLDFDGDDAGDIVELSHTSMSRMVSIRLIATQLSLEVCTAI